MCGICGELYFDWQASAGLRLVNSMLDYLHHRGPDDEGIYISGQVALGHRRLSIIDLNTGKQPISNEDGTVWTVFNGEIYNFRQLRQELIECGHFFSTATDTEVIVHAYEEFGEEFVSRLDGMFALCVWDSRRRRLLLARDRVGIKPLYYTEFNDRLIFASEIKALLADPRCSRDVNSAVVDRFLTYGYSAGRETPFSRISKLEPGHFLSAVDGEIRLQQYWDLEFPPTARNLKFADAKAELDDLLDRTVRAHMISDVPVGVLLSGGVDSSGVLSYATAQGSGTVHTFTIGFGGQDVVDERPYARLAADRFGTEHHEITADAEEFQEALSTYVWHMEELICEPPAIGLYFVSKLARDAGVKVILSGEGGDEAFAGYNTYRNLLRVERIRRLGKPWPELAARLATTLGRLTGQKRLVRAASLFRSSLEEQYLGRTASASSYFGRLKRDLYTDAFQDALRANGLGEIASQHPRLEGVSPLSRMLYVDTKTWLPDDLLTKADKMTMANSVELRVPFLDHRVLEFAAQLPDSFKVRGGQTKHILKETLRRRVPAELLSRRKAGFPLPVSRWLRYELKDFVHSLLLDSKGSAREYLRRSTVQNLLAEHDRSGNRGKEVFSLVVLELWRRQFVGAPVNSTVASL